MGILVLSFLYIKRLPITNIYIVGNNILSDKEITDDITILVGVIWNNLTAQLD